MSEPPQKRLKTAEDKKVDYVFGDDADRFLLIEGKLFHVQSNKLIRHSEYFRALFTSGFSEKDKKEIEIKGIDADDARVFFIALFERDAFDVQDVDLECLIKTSNYFQANEYLVELFEENPISWLDNLSPEKILTLAVDHGILELKDAVEKSLIVDFNQRLKLKKPTVDSRGSNEIDESFVNCLRLITDYGLVSMKAVVDNHLTDYYRVNRKSHSYERPWISLIREHQLNQLKEEMEAFAIAAFEEDHEDYESILSKYGDAINSLPLNKLKDNAEQLLMVFIKRKPCDMVECLELFEIGVTYNMDSLKTSIEEYMWLECLEEEGTFMYNWRGIVSNFNPVHYMGRTRGTRYFGSKSHIRSINLILELLLNKGLDRIKDKLEDFLIAEFNMIKENRINRYNKSIEMVSQVKYLPRYKDAIEAYLVDHFKATRDFDNTQLDDLYPKFKDTIEEYLIDDFEATRDFKRAEFAFTRGYPKFKDVLTAFLSTTHTNDPVMQANREHILNLSESDQNYIFRCLFREK